MTAVISENLKASGRRGHRWRPSPGAVAMVRMCCWCGVWHPIDQDFHQAWTCCCGMTVLGWKSCRCPQNPTPVMHARHGASISRLDMLRSPPATGAICIGGPGTAGVSQTLLGVTGSDRTFTMANVIARMGRPAIVFAPNKTLASAVCTAVREFFRKTRWIFRQLYYGYYQPGPTCPLRDMFIERQRHQRAYRANASVLRKACWSGAMWSSSPRCRPSMALATLSYRR